MIFHCVFSNGQLHMFYMGVINGQVICFYTVLHGQVHMSPLTWGRKSSKYLFILSMFWAIFLLKVCLNIAKQENFFLEI